MSKNSWSNDSSITTVFTNGCFDLLHVGHMNLLMKCRSLAGPNGKVVLALDSDEKISKDKGSTRPFFSWGEREAALSSLVCHHDVEQKLIDEIVKFDSNEDLYKLIQEVCPRIIVKGEDWKTKGVIGADIAEVEFCTISCEVSTSSITDRIRER